MINRITWKNINLMKIKEKVNECLKSIDLIKNFRNFFYEIKSQLIFSTAFHIYHKSDIKIS